MVVNFKVFKKVSPNGKLTLYLGKRDFVDHISSVEPIDGVIVVDDDYLRDRKVFGQVVCSFRYGREEDEVMGLNFQKDLYLASEMIYPPPEKREDNLTKLQERLLKKLGPNAFPFKFTISPSAPASVILQPGPEDQGEPCGVQFYVKIFVGENETDRSHRRSTVALAFRKVQYAPSKQGRQPCTVVRKDFLLSPGELELEVTLDKQLYHHGERVAVNICIRNNSNKVVKKIKAMVQQGIDVVLFQNGQYRTSVASLETQEGCPIQPGSSLQKIMYLTPMLESNKDRRGVALDGQLKSEDTNLASSTLLATADHKDAFGIVVSYSVKVKLFLGALGGEVSAELPFILMHPKPETLKGKLLTADSQADVESFRQDTVDEPGLLAAN
ncbi:arrestin homolog [Macrosteles quadrilineatus]|uniref:arrestin homolog n=1 Tax=Macrosteles quadrilineatus TaxID=74068 RepID=UPI0023E1AD3C|nr:arrestin homolog [Macrosteles quadrilineatus]